MLFLFDTGAPFTVLDCVDELIPREKRYLVEIGTRFDVSIQGLKANARRARPDGIERGLCILGLDFLRRYDVSPIVDWSTMTWRLGGGKGFLIVKKQEVM